MEKERASAPFRGRGALGNPANRFEKIEYFQNEEEEPDEGPGPRTDFFIDASRGVIARNDSPDIGFGASLNPYRGCEHGCIYCYARPTHEYLGFSAGLDFESKIMVKRDAPELLRKELSSPRWKPQVLAMSGVTDCYQPIERRLRLTRRCLEVLVEFRNPVAVITKNRLVTRDRDLFAELARHDAAAVCLSITTLDEKLARILEPRASHPRQRLAAIEELAQAGVPVSVNAAPIIPGLNDHEIPAIISAAAQAGAQSAGFTPLRLPYGVAALFEEWLALHFPDRKEKVLNQIKAMRGGRLNDPHFGSRMEGRGIIAEQMAALFDLGCRKARIGSDWFRLSTESFRRPPGPQLTLFD